MIFCNDYAAWSRFPTEKIHRFYKVITANAYNRVQPCIFGYRVRRRRIVFLNRLKSLEASRPIIDSNPFERHKPFTAGTLDILDVAFAIDPINDSNPTSASSLLDVAFAIDPINVSNPSSASSLLDVAFAFDPESIDPMRQPGRRWERSVNVFD